MVQDKNTPRSHWPPAQIVSIYHGDDRIVRTVKIRTPSGEFFRPSQSLILLENSKQQNVRITSVLCGRRLF